MNKLGIIAGSGRMPALIIEQCQRQGRDFFVVGLEGFAEAETIGNVQHKIVRLGAVGEALKTLKTEKCEEVILAGRVARPNLSSLRPDFTATMLMAKFGSKLFSGDDALLSAIVGFMEGEGLTVVGMKEVLSELLAPVGIIGKHKPSKQHYDDIERGMKAVKHLGELDIGQAVIVENGYILGVEAAEGTDELMKRCAQLSQHEAGNGVLVKAKKPTQDPRADLPTIGPETIENAHRAGYAGVAVAAGASIILDRDKLVALADAYGLFIVGVASE